MKASDFVMQARAEIAKMKRPITVTDLGNVYRGFRRYDINGELCWLLDDPTIDDVVHGAPLLAGDGRIEGVYDDTDVNTLVIVQAWGPYTDYVHGEVRTPWVMNDLIDALNELDVNVDDVVLTSFWAHLDESMPKFISKNFLRDDSLYKRRCFSTLERQINLLKPEHIIVFGKDLFIHGIAAECGIHCSEVDQSAHLVARRWDASVTICRTGKEMGVKAARVWKTLRATRRELRATLHAT